MVVVQDGPTTAPGAGKPERTAAASISAVRADLRWVTCGMPTGVGKGLIGSAQRSPTVEQHPVCDGVTAVGRMVVRAVQATPDFCGELSLGTADPSGK